MALAAIAVAPMIALTPGLAAADTAVVPAPGSVHPVVLFSQLGPLGAILSCAPVGIVPIIGPNVIFPICLV
ncbi:hypothetical protein [Rhodococcus sp. NPDC127528]|uniref:hypothetical protein n=1 Tax=unclassified Rhodococcus (in: high G+C Gram-positive bacteria) TaxID=192944 RepID=UPI00363A699E